MEFEFPKGFLWGASTAAHQVEGDNLHSDWWAWEQAGRVNERSGAACDHYRRFAQDFDLAESLHHSAHRFSIEWSRVEPAEGQWDGAALAHYAEVVRALRSRGLEPIVTLHHFTTPQWLVRQGGWTTPKAVEHFQQYVARVVDTLGSSVRYWITINEPMVYVRMHFIQGLGPPGAKSLPKTLQVVEHLVRAHAAAYRIIHAQATPAAPAPLVSIAHNVPAFWPCRWYSPLDHLVTWMTDRIFILSWFQALTTGRWSVPGVTQRWHVPEAANTLDYIGLNYYGRQFIRYVPPPGVWPGDGCDLGHHPRQVTERTSMGWDVHPASLLRVLMRLKPYCLPILVTENGTSMADDARRWSYIHRHLQAMARAMRRGVSVIGYCYWSLLDNFEWADGYGPRFGIVEVDYATQERRPRPSAYQYAEVCRTNRIQLNNQG
ncbi:MAG: glycoside hydrolase family 1 protein [Candidatus Omnitrophica bacterium]|nr:glycoside hydrolase family 1 protein [Candidatus Omnitrophota bacterium]